LIEFKKNFIGANYEEKKGLNTLFATQEGSWKNTRLIQTIILRNKLTPQEEWHEDLYVVYGRDWHACDWRGLPIYSPGPPKFLW
jgi:hypothetical protein